jgi:O-antigen/teichoic acid export membrane protein
MIWSIVFAYLAVPNARLMLVHNRQRQAGMMTGLTMVTNVLLNVALIPRLGIIGAAMARTSSTAITYFMLYGYTQRYLLKAGLLSLVRGPLISVILMAVVVWWLRDLPLYIPIIIGAMIYGAAALLLGAISREDRLYLQRFGSSRKRH